MTKTAANHVLHAFSNFQLLTLNFRLFKVGADTGLRFKHPEYL